MLCLVNEIGAEIRQAFLSQFSLLEELLFENLSVKDYERINLGESHPGNTRL